MKREAIIITVAGFVAVFVAVSITISASPKTTPASVDSTPTVEKHSDLPNGIKVKIIDVRKDGDCENQTLMEDIDIKENLRFSRCGYYGAIGDTFWWVE